MTSSSREQAEPADRDDRGDRQNVEPSQPGRPPRLEAWPPRQERRAGPRRFDDLF